MNNFRKIQTYTRNASFHNYSLTLSTAVSLALFLILCSAQPGADAADQAVSPEPEWIYTARPGDSVQSIATKYLANTNRWTELLRYNRTSNTGLLPPGTPVRIPLSMLKSYPKSATLLASQGKVWFRKAYTTAYVPALSGLKLNIGDELKTQDGFAFVKFADGSNLRVAKHSIIVFNTLTHYGETGMVDTRLRLNNGGIKTEVSPRKGPAARYEVSTPSAVAAVRGTSFRLRVSNSMTITEVTEGTVQISNATGSLSLQAGQGASIASTGNLSRLQLLPPPEITVPERLSEPPFSLAWPPVTGAAAYIVEVFNAGPDNLPMMVNRIDSPNMQLPALANGEYDVNVRAVDVNSIEGVDAKVHFQVEQQARPAELITPLSGAALNELQPIFSWRANVPVMLSSLEISQDQQFQKLFTRTPFASQQVATTEQPLSAGEYYWRVVTMAGGNTFAYSESRPLTIQDTLEKTRIIAVNYLEDRVKVFWKSVKHAETYLVQLSEDELFQRLVQQDEQQMTSALLRLTPGKTYWVRVKGIGNDFYASTFGEPQLLKIQP